MEEEVGVRMKKPWKQHRLLQLKQRKRDKRKNDVNEFLSNFAFDVNAAPDPYIDANIEFQEQFSLPFEIVTPIKRQFNEDDLIPVLEPDFGYDIVEDE